jgi:EAL domain-containing protein (putative c-di-GMP-specific phosphodiesterase class I)
MYPGTFIELAEQQGLMDKLGMAIFEVICRDMVEHQLPDPFRVAVNLSQQQFYNQNLLVQLESKAVEFGLNLSRFQFEVTETATMENLHLMGDLLEDLKEKQADILLDDFGTGYASLSILKNLPVNILKIDQSFVKDIGTSKEVETLITAIIAMAKALGLALVAEGVETETQLDWLTAQQVDFMQGYFLARPEPPFKLR